MALKVITPPTAEAITLAQAKVQCGVDADITKWDDLLNTAIRDARERAEAITGRYYMPTVVDQVLDGFPACAPWHLSLGTAPVQAIQSVIYMDADGADLTLDPAAYVLDDVRSPCWALLAAGAAWPASFGANSVRVRFVAGYAPLAATADQARAAVPAPILQWMRLQIGAAYRNREAFAQGVSIAELPNRYTDGLLDLQRLYLTV